MGKNISIVIVCLFAAGGWFYLKSGRQLAVERSAQGDSSSLQAEGLSEQDLVFLQNLMTDTWACLDAMIHPVTGLPSDTQKHEGATNTTNIGLYLASLCVAEELGLVDVAFAQRRVAKILTSLEAYERMHGFMPNFIEVDLSETSSTGVMAVSDFNKLATGLIMARQSWPNLAPRISDFLDQIEWHRLYNPDANPDSGQLSWGYDFDNDRDMGWGRLWLTADTRSAVFMIIAAGGADPAVWERMERQLIETDYGNISRGYGMGGLFLHAMDGIFLSEIDTEVGESAGNLAWQQIQFSKKRNYPLWGWSNCYMPDDSYTEGGFLSEHVVTPHSVALMVEYYPRHVVATLREMVRRGGMLPPPGYEGKQWGLRDAYNMKTKRWDARYLSLDQGMLFLSLANYLHDGLARKIYQSDPLVQSGLKKIEPYMPQRAELSQRWAQRDAQWQEYVNRLSQINLGNEAQPHDLAQLGKTQDLSLARFKSSSPEDRLQVEAVKNSAGGDAIRMHFSRKERDDSCELSVALQPMDWSSFLALELDLQHIASSSEPLGDLRILIQDQYQQTRYIHLPLSKGQKTYRIEADNLLGIWIDESSIVQLQLQFWPKPWFYTSRRMQSSECELQLNAARLIIRP